MCAGAGSCRRPTPSPVGGSLAGNESAISLSYVPFVYSTPNVSSESMNALFALASGTRSCGRRGPASDGSTSSRSSSTTCEYSGMLVGLVPEPVLLAVRLDERDPLGVAAGEAQVPERHVVDGEEAARRAGLGAHVPERRAVGEGERADARPEVLDELPDDAGLAQDLGHGEHEVGRGRAFAQRAASAGSRRPAARASRAPRRASPPRPRCRRRPSRARRGR